MKNFNFSRLICILAGSFLFLTIIGLVLNSFLTIIFAIISLILFIIESYIDKEQQRKGAVDFVMITLLIIIIYRIFI